MLWFIWSNYSVPFKYCIDINCLKKIRIFINNFDFFLMYIGHDC
jgi:hypothetical protein